jgi:short-subunit dehydrogenase
VITGASSGIGEATARRLDRDGWRLVLVARRADRLEAVAQSLRDASALPVDLTEPTAPARVAERIEALGRLDLLVNNAGSARRAEFAEAEGGWANVQETMRVNFDAPVRLTEALLPFLRRSAPSALVNVSSVAGRVGMPRSGAYCASKFALAGWSDALAAEERQHRVHVGLVLPGFAATEGFPQEDLMGSAATRWAVSTPERVAEAIVDAGPGRRPERYVPRPYALVGALRAVAPAAVRRIAGRVRR